MELSHINNECNDGRDNNPEPLGEGHSSHSLTKDVTKRIQRKKNDLGKLTYELSSTNILDKMTIRYQYTRSMMENARHIHTCTYYCYCCCCYYYYYYYYYYFTYIKMCILIT